MIKLGSYIELVSGRDLTKSQYNDKKKGIPYIIGASNMTDGILNIERWTQEPTVIGKKDDLIISVKGTVGELLILEENEVHLSRQVMAIRSKSGYEVKFIFYYLKYYLDKLKEKAKGMIPGITREDILGAEFIEMSKDKQQKIIKILDSAQTLIDKRKDQIESLDELVKSRFIEMFGNPFVDEKGYGTNKLGEVAEVNPKKSETKELDRDLSVSFVPMDRVGEKGEFKPEVSKPISELYSGFTYFKDNDVLFAKITPCMENGKGAIATNLTNGIGFGSTEFHVIRPISEKSNPYWIYHLVTLIEFRRLAQRKMTGSAGQKRVPIDFLKNIEVVVPPLELQNQFADFVNHIDKLKFEMEKGLKELEDNFNSLMQKAFSGELFN